MLLYSIFLLAIILVIFSYHNLLNKQSIVVLNLSFYLVLVFSLSVAFFKIKDFPPDALIYAEIIDDFENFDQSSYGVKYHSIINYFTFKLCFGFPIIYIVFSTFYYFIGILFVWKAYQISYNENKKSSFTLFLILASIYPAALITVPTLLRESATILYIGYGLYFMARKGQNRKIQYYEYLFFLLSFLALCSTRLILGFSMLIIICGFWLAKNFKPSKIPSLLIAIVISLLALNYMATEFYDVKISFQWLAKFRAKYDNTYGIESFGTNLDWSNHWNASKNIVLLAMQYLFSPLPVLIDSQIMMKKTIPLIDALFVFITISLVLLNKDLRKQKLWFFWILVFLIPSALFETNISGAYRHRMNVVILLLPMLTYAIVSLRKRLIIE